MRHLVEAWLHTILGLAVLILGAELLVRGAVWIALALGVRPMTVGLTLVAFGTSAPELVVSLDAAALGKPGIALGTVLGSNLANILLIVGLAAAVKAIRIKPDRLECNYLLLAAALTALPLAFDDRIERWMGIVMLVMLLVFTAQLLRREQRSRGYARSGDAVLAFTAGGLAAHILLAALGVLGLKVGGDLLVAGASEVALQLGMGEAVVGMTIVAIGTSLPELATSVLAAQKGHPEICIGNVMGSNVFNVGMVLGVTATVFPLAAPWAETGPPVLAGAIAAALLVFLQRTTGGIQRAVGFSFLLGYAGYLTLEVLSS